MLVEADPPQDLDYQIEAKRIRAVAATVKDTKVRQQLLAIASLYERLAAHVRRVGSTPSDKVS
jgi:hypothetical protein